jgi:hypothetical protein
VTTIPALGASYDQPRAANDSHTAPSALALLGAEGVALLRTAPVVHLAWLLAPEIGDEDRRTVLQTARLRGVAPGTRAHRVLDAWLTERPSEDYFTSALLELKALLPALPADVQAATKHDLVAYLMFLDRAALDVRARRAIVGVPRPDAGRRRDRETRPWRGRPA